MPGFAAVVTVTLPLRDGAGAPPVVDLSPGAFVPPRVPAPESERPAGSVAVPPEDTSETRPPGRTATVPVWPGSGTVFVTGDSTEGFPAGAECFGARRIDGAARVSAPWPCEPDCADGQLVHPSSGAVSAPTPRTPAMHPAAIVPAKRRSRAADGVSPLMPSRLFSSVMPDPLPASFSASSR